MHIRWMIRRDMPSVLEIEGLSFDEPWTEQELINCLRQRNCIGMVAEKDDEVIGYVIYELHKQRLHLLNLAVHPRHRRTGAGSAIIHKLIDKLNPERRNRIVTEVRETNLAAQLFLKDLGFRATEVLREFYDEGSEDAYLMMYRCQSPLALDISC